MLFDLASLTIGLISAAHIFKVYGSPLSAADVDRIIFKLENLKRNEGLLKRIEKYVSSNSKNRLNNKQRMHDFISRNDIINELKKRSERKINSHRGLEKKYGTSHLRKNFYNLDSIISKQLEASALNENPIRYYNRIKQHGKQKDVYSNRLLGQLYSYKGRPRNEKTNEYSKIFMILNPQAIHNGFGGNKDELKKLLSQVRSVNLKHHIEVSDRGSNVQNNLLGGILRRVGRYEKASGEEYKAHRGRGDKGSMGRTSIPYVGRGDIYEKE